MPDREAWEFINSFAPWLAAVGTLTSAVVALYLARRAARLSARVTAAIVKLTTPDSPEYLRIAVVNSGFRDVPVAGVMWKASPWSKQSWIVLSAAQEISTRLPAKLGYGEEAQFFLDATRFKADAEPLLAFLRQSRTLWLRLRVLRVGVYTLTGEQLLTPPDVYVRNWLRLRTTSA